MNVKVPLEVRRNQEVQQGSALAPGQEPELPILGSFSRNQGSGKAEPGIGNLELEETTEAILLMGT